MQEETKNPEVKSVEGTLATAGYNATNANMKSRIKERTIQTVI